MRYYARYNTENKLLLVGTGPGGVEIAKEEYDRLFEEIRQKADLVNKLCSGEIALSDVPEEWREEIKRRVDERIRQQGAADEQEISAEEALDIILGGEG